MLKASIIASQQQDGILRGSPTAQHATNTLSDSQVTAYGHLQFQCCCRRDGLQLTMVCVTVMTGEARTRGHRHALGLSGAGG